MAGISCPRPGTVLKINPPRYFVVELNVRLVQGFVLPWDQNLVSWL